MHEIDIYSVYDKASKIYDTPFFTSNEIMARRQFISLIKSGKGPVADFPEEFKLIKIGVFEIESGNIKPENKTVITGASVAAALAETNQK